MVGLEGYTWGTGDEPAFTPIMEALGIAEDTWWEQMGYGTMPLKEAGLFVAGDSEAPTSVGINPVELFETMTLPEIKEVAAQKIEEATGIKVPASKMKLLYGEVSSE
jgi:hypothetical protein